MKIRKIIWLVLAAVVLAGCKKAVQVYDVRVEDGSISVVEGGTYDLHANVYPDDGQYGIEWLTGDESVATVLGYGSKGIVTGVSVGVTFIVCSVNGAFRDTCLVTVDGKDPFSYEVTLNKESMNLEAGSSLALKATVYPSEGYSSVVWGITDSSKVTAVADGLTCTVTGTEAGTTYVYCRVDEDDCDSCEVIVRKSFSDLSERSTANCYIVSERGTYKFNAMVKGNSTDSVGTPASADVLWESLGTDEVPDEGDVITDVVYSSGYVKFATPSELNDGNALIAVRDGVTGDILWSWHIWVCSGYVPTMDNQQKYRNNAGVMMDRNLGALSSTPGDVRAGGLMYQWGRKDPFTNAAATGDRPCPEAVSSHLSPDNTLQYAISHPTTFITSDATPFDWYCTEIANCNDTLWQTAFFGKTAYDPCPAGWRVPDGGDIGVWKTAGFPSSHEVDAVNRGMDFSDCVTPSHTCWYPFSGCLNLNTGSILDEGDYGYYWSCTPCFENAYLLHIFSYHGQVYPSNNSSRAYGQSVRCLAE